MPIARTELAKLRWLDLAHVGDRIIHMMPVFGDGTWTDSIPAADGRLVEIRPHDVRGLYLSTAPAFPSDLQFEFLETIWQRVSYPLVARHATAIADDVENLATALTKLAFFARHAVELGHGVGSFVRTEVEYILVVARSLLDHLHEVTTAIWNTVELVDPEQQRQKASRKLPKRMSKTCLTESGARSAAELSEAHAFSLPIATAYAGVGTYLQRVRRLRDGVVHRGRTPGPIFLTSQGFGIDPAGPLAQTVPEIWTAGHSFSENVVSLRPLVSYVAVGALAACSSVTRALTSCIRLPPPLAPAHRVFMRTDHAQALHDAEAVLGGGEAWWPTS